MKNPRFILLTICTFYVVVLTSNLTDGLQCYSCQYEEIDGMSAPGSDPSCMTEPAKHLINCTGKHFYQSGNEAEEVVVEPTTCVTIAYIGKLTNAENGNAPNVTGILRKCIFSETSEEDNLVGDCNKGNLDKRRQDEKDAEIKYELQYLSTTVDPVNTQTTVCTCSNNGCNGKSVGQEKSGATGVTTILELILTFYVFTIGVGLTCVLN